MGKNYLLKPNKLVLSYLFERELASLVALQVVSSKGEEEENFLTSFDKPRIEA